MEYLTRIINDAKQAVPGGVTVHRIAEAPESWAPPVAREATVVPKMMQEEQARSETAVIAKKAAPLISGDVTAEHPAVTAQVALTEASRMQAYGGMTPAPLQTDGEDTAAGRPIGADKPSPACLTEDEMAVGNHVLSHVRGMPSVPVQPVKASGGELGSKGAPAQDAATSCPPRIDLPHVSQKQEPAKKATADTVAPSPSFALTPKESASASQALSNSPGTMAPSRTSAGANGKASAEEAVKRQVRTSPFRSPGNPGMVSSSKPTPLDRGDRNAVESGVCSREHAAVQGEIIEPRVHIGRVDISVLAAEPARQGPAPATTQSDLASRLYLRRL